MKKNLNKGRKVFCKLPFLMAYKDPKLTQKELASTLKLSPTTVNRLYNGQPLTARINPTVVEKLCNYFNCQVGDLLVMQAAEDL